MFGRATITLGIGPHSSFLWFRLSNVANVNDYTTEQYYCHRYLLPSSSHYCYLVQHKLTVASGRGDVVEVGKDGVVDARQGRVMWDWPGQVRREEASSRSGAGSWRRRRTSRAVLVRMPVHLTVQTAVVMEASKVLRQRLWTSCTVVRTSNQIH